MSVHDERFSTINIGLQDIHPNINSLISGNFSNIYHDVWQDATAGQDETDVYHNDSVKLK